MKIVNIKGGLGNQMFQCAFAMALKKKYPNDLILIDIQLYKFPILKTFHGNNFYHNGFEINNIFPNVDFPFASWKQICRVSYYIPNYILNRAARKILPIRETEYIQLSSDAYIFNPQLFESKGIAYYDGYWFSPRFFDFCKAEIQSMFEFRRFDTDINNELAEKLKLDNSVTIHIRRGDFLNLPTFNNICTLDYYRKAILEAIKYVSKPVFFVFSNDMQWCRENLETIIEDSIIYVDNNFGSESYRDMQLMSLARCNILANSSFSWWGAYLNQRNNHIVFTPKKWVNMPCEDAYCNSWIKI